MLNAYCWPQSAVGGEAIELHCSSSGRTFDVEVVRQGLEETPVWSARTITSEEHETPTDVGERGCRWPVSLSITVDHSWRSGFYLVRLRNDAGETAEAFFVVRAATPGDALMVLSTTTWAAYNDWGGPSFYTGGHTSSFERPLPKGFLARPDVHRFRAARVGELSDDEIGAYLGAGYSLWVVAAGWSSWEYLFAQWAEREGLQVDYAVSSDLETVGGLLDPYKLYLSVGHDEYWSAGMRDVVENWIEDGGRIAFFSGNTSFWQIRFENDHRAVVAYKLDIDDDPVRSTDRERELSTMWCDPLVGRPENEMTGVGFIRGGYAHLENAPMGSGGYTVWRPGSFVFEGLDLRAGDIIGAEPVVVGYECDGCDLQLDRGLPVATGRDGTPSNFEVLATAPAHLWETRERPAALGDLGAGELNWAAQRLAGADTPENRERFAHGNAVMGTFVRGNGRVFTTGCTDWAFGLNDPAISRVTKNVVRAFLR